MNDDEELKFFDSWHKSEDTPFQIDDKVQERCEELNVLFENHFSLDSFESSRVFFLIQKKALNELNNKGMNNDDNFVYGEIVKRYNISRHSEHLHIYSKV